MKALLSKQLGPCGAVLAGLLVASSTFIHPSGPVKHPQNQALPSHSLHLPPQAIAVLNRSCMDCHSNRTVWPWYSYIAPMSWLIERDVRAGRDHLNLSEWDRYSLKEQTKLLADVASVVKNHEMPLPQYLLLHRDAKLSDAETDPLYQWARLERRKRKGSSPLFPATARQFIERHCPTSSAREIAKIYEIREYLAVCFGTAH